MQGSGAVAGKLREWRYQALQDKPLASGTGERMKIIVWKEESACIMVRIILMYFVYLDQKVYAYIQYMQLKFLTLFEGFFDSNKAFGTIPINVFTCKKRSNINEGVRRFCYSTPSR